MSKQTEWQARQRALGCCISCGRTADRKADGTHYAYCPDCRVKRQQQQRRGPAGGRWQCRLHPGRSPVRSKLRGGEWYCGVRLMDGSRCQLASSDETPDEARARVSERDEFRTQPALPVPEWRCSRHPDATPRPANTPGHWYCAMQLYGRSESESQYCGESSAAETEQEHRSGYIEDYRRQHGALPWKMDGDERPTPTDETDSSPEDDYELT